MPRIFPLLSALLFAGTLNAQSYTYDRNTGEVTVAGKPVFYLVKTGGALGYEVRNAAGQDLIHVSNGEMNKEGRGDVAGYKFTFAASGNYCSFLPSSFGFNTAKSIITTVLRNNLIAADTVTADSERAFVQANHGRYFGPAGPQLVMNAHTGRTPPPALPASPAPTASTAAGSLRLEGEKAFLGDRLLATFRDERQGSEEEVRIYGTDDVRVAQARRFPVSNSDWTIELPDKTTVQLRFYPNRSIERLLEFLLTKGYLK